jgi:hypothetical protein
MKQESFMQVLCAPSESSADIYCPVCGKGFRLYWERPDRIAQLQHLRDIYDELRTHHEGSPLAGHPDSAFTVPRWSGLPKYSGAALLGGAA